ncbi:heme/hemin ABC transporter substrate-binding protein [Rhizobium sp. SAFR-030]|uniref:heme/hemin ABC transporter substrate-binding protein n=1 Tax=Rhizobium sp. SAFR-030 TaxID=3387277 RepID=UPI003F7EF95A
MAKQKRFRRLGLPVFGVLAAIAAGSALAAEPANPAARRIVSIGSAVTEILYELGAQDRIVAVDSTSTYPQGTKEKPDIGYLRALSPEGIIGQNPDLILLQDGAGPPDALTVLRASGIATATIKALPLSETIPDKIRDVGAAVGLADKADVLAQKTKAELDAALAETAKIPQPRKRVLFILSVANGRIMAGGKGTEAAAMIEMAGGINAADQITGYKPLTDEAVIAARPDYVLVMQSGNHHLTPDQVFSLPAFLSTPAADNRALLQMDGLLLTGFGPRTPTAIGMLTSQLYPQSN